MSLEKQYVRPVRRPWRTLLISLILIVLIIVLTLSWSSWHDQGLYDAAIVETNQLDPGWRWEDIQSRRRIPDEGNGAKIAIEAIYLLGIDEVQRPKPQWGLDYYKMLDSIGFEAFVASVVMSPQARIDSEKRKLIQSLLNRDPGPRAIEIARRLSRVEQGCFQHRQFGPLIPQTLHSDVQSSRGMVSVLEYDSWIQCEAGQTEVALVNVGAMLGVSRAIGDDPDDTCQFLQLICTGVSARNLQRVLAQSTDASQERLRQLHDAFQKEASQPILHWVIKGHRAAIDHDLTLVQSGKVPITKWGHGLTLSRWETGWKYLDKQLMERFPRQMIDPEYAPSPWHIERAALHRYCNEALRIADQPEEKWLALIREHNQQTALPHFVAQLLRVQEVRDEADKSEAPSVLEKLTALILRTRSLARCAAAACAAERFRLEQGRLPVKWQDVVPQYLAAIPIDPFTGKPMLFHRLENGLVIYSIGADGKDDQGDVLPTIKKGTNKDIGMRLWDVPLRRQAPLPVPVESKE